MNIGTRSVLYGYHCWLLHWLFVARGWYQLHGFSFVVIGRRPDELYGEDWEDVSTSLFDPRLWIGILPARPGLLGLSQYGRC